MDNLTSVDPLSYTTNGSKVDPSLTLQKTTPKLPVEAWTDRKVSNSSLNYPPKENRSKGMTIT